MNVNYADKDLSTYSRTVSLRVTDLDLTLQTDIGATDAIINVYDWYTLRSSSRRSFHSKHITMVNEIE